LWLNYHQYLLLISVPQAADGVMGVGLHQWFIIKDVNFILVHQAWEVIIALVMVILVMTVYAPILAPALALLTVLTVVLMEKVVL
jgi:hypothetical protein